MRNINQLNGGQYLYGGFSEPYSSMSAIDLSEIDRSNGIWDCWSIGIIILEVLVGTELVLRGGAYEDVNGLIADFEAYLDPEILVLLDDLLFHAELKTAESFLKVVLHEKPDILT